MTIDVTHRMCSLLFQTGQSVDSSLETGSLYLRPPATRSVRINNIATQATARKCILPFRDNCLFCSYFLTILILLECTQSPDNLFHAFTDLWEKEYFLTSNLLCPVSSVKSCKYKVIPSQVCHSRPCRLI